MKKIIYSGLFIALSLFSCKDDVLDKQPLDIISDAVLWSDPVLIDGFLMQQYAQTPTFVQDCSDAANNSAWGKQRHGPFFTNGLTDESLCAWSLEAINPAGYKSGNLKVGGGMLEYWELPYKTIRSLNEFIERVPTSTLAAPVKKNRIAEARFIRAFNYFSMVKRYGGVPLITKVQKLDDPKEELFPPRDSEQKIYDFIISEMDAIVNDLPESYSAVDFGRPTKYAALALQSRAALYAGSIAKYGTLQLNGLLGIPANLSTSYFQKAYDASKAVVAGGKHDLYKADADKVKNFKNIFLVKRNTEGIFVVQHNAGVLGSANPWGWDFGQSPKPHPWNNGNINSPYLEMVEEFEYTDGRPGKLDYTAIQSGLWTTADLWKDKDPRFFATIYTQNSTWKGTTVNFYYGVIKTDGSVQLDDGTYQGVAAKGTQQTAYGFGVNKYLDENVVNDNTSKSSTDYLVFRYAETLLNLAEAAFELDKSTEALDAINQIRIRAGIAVLTSIDMNKIRHERLVELAFENHRYWDLRRWRTATSVLSVNRSSLRYILDFTTKKYKLEVVKNIDGTVAPPKFNDFNYYFPITNSRRGANSNLVENPGY